MRAIFMFIGLCMPFYTAKSAANVFEIIQKCNPETTIVLTDIDDTLVTPQARAFRRPPYNKMIDKIKARKAEYSNFDAIISNWRLQRKLMLIDPVWPAFLEKLKSSFKVYGLTKMDTGPLGSIPSVEAWRFDELCTLGITFTTIPNLSEHTVRPTEPNFYKGILFTGAAEKDETLETYWDHLSVGTLTIVMIDDRMEHLEKIQRFCDKKGLACICIHYTGLFELVDVPVPEIAEFQEKMLIETGQWFEDSDAAELLLNETSSSLRI